MQPRVAQPLLDRPYRNLPKTDQILAAVMPAPGPTARGCPSIWLNRSPFSVPKPVRPEGGLIPRREQSSLVPHQHATFQSPEGFLPLSEIIQAKNRDRPLIEPVQSSYRFAEPLPPFALFVPSPEQATFRA